MRTYETSGRGARETAVELDDPRSKRPLPYPGRVASPIVRTAVAGVFVAAAATGAFSALTQGFTVVTSEGARQRSVQTSPRVVPSFKGTDQNGNAIKLFTDGGGTGATSVITVVDFIYTRCTSICRAIGDSDSRLQAAILRGHLEGTVHLVTVTFDPANDTSDVLRRYATRMGSDPRVWTLMRSDNTGELAKLLKAFGVVVVRAPMDQFQHNAAYHLLDRNGRLARIVDADDPSETLAAALELRAHESP